MKKYYANGVKQILLCNVKYIMYTIYIKKIYDNYLLIMIFFGGEIRMRENLSFEI